MDPAANANVAAHIYPTANANFGCAHAYSTHLHAHAATSHARSTHRYPHANTNLDACTNAHTHTHAHAWLNRDDYRHANSGRAHAHTTAAHTLKIW